jgi:hypothetical protein
MPELLYALRHPVQEFRLARLARASRPPRPPRHPVRAALRLDRRIRRREAIAYRIIGGDALDFPDEVRDDLLGQDQGGYLVVRSSLPDHWELFKPWKMRHLRAAFASRREQSVNMLDLESGGSDNG